MSDLEETVEKLKSQVGGGLIVSCQAPPASPLHRPDIIAAFARAAEIGGACAVRIDSPAHIAAVKATVALPVFGIYKVVADASEVYITPTFDAAREVAAAGADIIAVDATARRRPGGERLEDLCARIRAELGVPVMADVATLEEGIAAAETLGCDFVSTTLSGYTAETSHLLGAADFALVERLAARVDVPVICEGRLRTPEDARRALDAGAFAVVVGKAITGVDILIEDFMTAVKQEIGRGQTRKSTKGL